MENPNQIDEQPTKSTPLQIVGVPRQYGVGTLLLITAMYAVLFSFLQCFQIPVVTFVLAVAFTTCVGLGQIFLFKGKNALHASIVVGMVSGGLFECVHFATQLFGNTSPLFWQDTLLIAVMLSLLVITKSVFNSRKTAASDSPAVSSAKRASVRGSRSIARASMVPMRFSSQETLPRRSSS